MTDTQPSHGEKFRHETTAASVGKDVDVNKGGNENLQVTSVAVKEDDLRKALRQDQGINAHLLSWSRHDFTKKGDNYVAEVTSVRVKYSIGEQIRHNSYVVKMRRGSPDSHFDDMVFLKEGKFYTELVPLLNAELIKAGQEPLRVPCCYHTIWQEYESQIFLEDLRHRHFKMYDRKQPLTLAHADLTVRELARLHAASVLVQANSPQKLSSLVFLSWEMHNYSKRTLQTFEAMINGSLETASELASAANRMDMKAWFDNLSPRGADILSALIHPVAPFVVIGHGDCWVNNLLFREDCRGEPLEVMLVDFQLCRRSSPALDLNYLLFSSLTSVQRSHSLTQLLDSYYSTFQSVVTAAGHVPPFTQEQLTQEFQNKMMFGLIFGALAIPALMCDAHTTQEFTPASKDDIADYVLKKREKTLKMLSSNPLMLPRLKSHYEDVSLYQRL